jgi:hypothetical protein
MTINDYTLDQYAADIATDIISECDGAHDLTRDDAIDMASQHADNSEWVIYYHKAHELCQNCDTENGEQFYEDCGPWEDLTYNGIASIIAYGELHARIAQAIDAKLDEAGAAE